MASELRVDKIHNEGGDNDSGLDMSTNHVVAVKIAGSEKMRVHSDGNVGIGTNTPLSPLHISGSDGVLATLGATTELQIFVDGNEVSFRVDADNDDSNTVITFDTDGSERMRIDSDGDLFLGTGGGNAVSSSVEGISTFHADDDYWILNIGNSRTTSQHAVRFYNGNGLVGSISTNSSATSFNTSSDYRLKENVTTSWDATSRLKQLKPSRFNFKADKDITVDGFLAHEVSSVVPEAITGEKDAKDADGKPEYQAIDQSKLVPLLVKTIQELEARIAALEAK